MSLWGIQGDFRVEVGIEPGLEGQMNRLDWEEWEQHSRRREQHTQKPRGIKMCPVRVSSSSQEPLGAAWGLGRVVRWEAQAQLSCQ